MFQIFLAYASHHPSPVNRRDIKRASTRCSRVMSEVGGCWLMGKLFPDTGDKINLFLLRWLFIDPFYTGIHHHVFQAQTSKSNDTLQFSLARHAIASLFLCEDSSDEDLPGLPPMDLFARWEFPEMTTKKSLVKPEFFHLNKAASGRMNSSTVLGKNEFGSYDIYQTTMSC